MWVIQENNGNNEWITVRSGLSQEEAEGLRAANVADGKVDEQDFRIREEGTA